MRGLSSTNVILPILISLLFIGMMQNTARVTACTLGASFGKGGTGAYGPFSKIYDFNFFPE